MILYSSGGTSTLAKTSASESLISFAVVVILVVTFIVYVFITLLFNRFEDRC